MKEEQYIKMCEGAFQDIGVLPGSRGNFIGRGDSPFFADSVAGQLYSANQLLEYVMKAHFKKVWTDGEWTGKNES